MIKINPSSLKRHYRNFGLLIIIMLLYISAAGSPPHPGLEAKIARGKLSIPYYMNNIKQLHSRGIGAGDRELRVETDSTGITRQPAPHFTGQFKALAILVDFTDHPHTVSAPFFDSLIFSKKGRTVTDYYHEISYGQLDIITVNLPSKTGWQTAPQTYSYYVDGRNGTGNYPRNTQKLVEDLIDQVNWQVDFSLYDNNLDDTVDMFLVIHSGTGAEFTGNNNDIWSHKWNITPRYVDGVYIRHYTIQPEFWENPGDMTIGVYAHEMGHGFGLPDLYDTDYSSYGVGKWDLMSHGCWLGPAGMGSSPAHPGAWSRIQMGFAVPIDIETNRNSQAIANIEESNNIYRLGYGTGSNDEYFLVENRQKIGYDSYLPGSGLLIWHIDRSQPDNSQEWWPGLVTDNHFLVALEQADGLYEMEHKTDRGDSGDPFPGVMNNTSFSILTNPGSQYYSDSISPIMIDNISTSASIMTADLIVGLSTGSDDIPLPVTMELAQNYPNPFNPSTTIDFYVSEPTPVTLEIFNLMGQKVRTLINGQAARGNTSLIWKGFNDNGQPVTSGVYFYKLSVKDSFLTRKMILIR